MQGIDADRHQAFSRAATTTSGEPLGDFGWKRLEGVVKVNSEVLGVDGPAIVSCDPVDQRFLLCGFVRQEATGHPALADTAAAVERGGDLASKPYLERTIERHDW